MYFCLDSCLVYINFAHTQDHDYCICVGVPLALCGRLVLVCYHPKKWKTKKTPVECVVVNSGEADVPTIIFINNCLL